MEQLFAGGGSATAFGVRVEFLIGDRVPFVCGNAPHVHASGARVELLIGDHVPFVCENAPHVHAFDARVELLIGDHVPFVYENAPHVHAFGARVIDVDVLVVEELDHKSFGKCL